MSSENTASVASPKLDERKLYEIASKQTGFRNVLIKDITFTSDHKKGDSYMSSICRFTLEITGKDAMNIDQKATLPMFVKSLPKNLARRKTFRSADFFANETAFFTSVWPAMMAFVNSKGISGKLVEIPNCYSAHCDGHQDYIALEDLCHKGYKVVTRLSELDMNHTILILNALAKFHAISLAYKDQKPEEFKEVVSALKETYYAEKYRNWFSKFHKSLFTVALDAVEKELPTEYYEKVSQFLKKDLYGAFCKMALMRGPFCAVTHGDVWLPNFLFKYDDEQVACDVAVIDFQLTRYASLSTDFLFFMYTCVPTSLLNQHWDTFLDEYYQTLRDTTIHLGSELPWLSKETLKGELKAYGIFGVGIAIEGRIMSLQDDENVKDLEDIQGDHEIPLESIWTVKPFRSREKRKTMADMLKHAIEHEFI